MNEGKGQAPRQRVSPGRDREALTEPHSEAGPVTGDHEEIKGTRCGDGLKGTEDRHESKETWVFISFHSKSQFPFCEMKF